MNLFLIFLAFVNMSYLVKSRFSVQHKFKVLLVYLKLHLIAFIFRDKAITTSIMGYSFSCDNSTTLLYLFGEIFVRNQYFVGNINNSATIIDCGSNIGLSALYFSIMYPLAKIICFEPDVNAFNLLNNNVMQNNLTDRISINLAAVSNRDQKSDFYSALTNGDLRMSLYPERSKGKKVVINCVSLPIIFKRNKGQFILKMDVEGSEKEILKSLFETKTIDRCDSIIFECHHNIPNLKNILLDSLNILSQSGFDYVLSFDGLPHNTSTTEFQDVLIWAGKSKPKMK